VCAASHQAFLPAVSHSLQVTAAAGRVIEGERGIGPPVGTLLGERGLQQASVAEGARPAAHGKRHRKHAVGVDDVTPGPEARCLQATPSAVTGGRGAAVAAVAVRRVVVAFVSGHARGVAVALEYVHFSAQCPAHLVGIASGEKQD